MKVSLVCSRGSDSSLAASIGIEKIPDISSYTYASAWPRIFGIEKVDIIADLEPQTARAAAAIIKVASWANGSLSKRTWDVTSIPAEIPQPGEIFEDKTSLSGTSRLPTYNCASLPHFAVGLETLHTIKSPVEWSYNDASPEDPHILRLVPTDQDPCSTSIATGHWMIGLGIAEEVVDSPEDLELGCGEAIVLHVNGGDGPLLISQASAVKEFYAAQCKTDMTVYQAVPLL